MRKMTLNTVKNTLLTSTAGHTSLVMTDCTVNLSLSNTVIGRDSANSKLFLLKKQLKVERVPLFADTCQSVQ